MKSFLVPFVSMLIAEFGDKTMLVIFLLAEKWGVISTVIGAFIGTGLIMLVPIFFGYTLNILLPKYVILLIAGLLLVGTGVFMFFHKEEEEEGEGISSRSKKLPGWIIVALTIMILEFGDKTQLIAIGIASEYGGTLITWAGLTLGMFLIDISALVALPLVKKVPEKTFNVISSLIFFLLGIVELYRGIYFYIK